MKKSKSEDKSINVYTFAKAKFMHHLTQALFYLMLRSREL